MGSAHENSALGHPRALIELLISCLASLLSPSQENKLQNKVSGHPPLTRISQGMEVPKEWDSTLPYIYYFVSFDLELHSTKSMLCVSSLSSSSGMCKHCLSHWAFWSSVRSVGGLGWQSCHHMWNLSSLFTVSFHPWITTVTFRGIEHNIEGLSWCLQHSLNYLRFPQPNILTKLLAPETTYKNICICLLERKTICKLLLQCLAICLNNDGLYVGTEWHIWSLNQWRGSTARKQWAWGN